MVHQREDTLMISPAAADKCTFFLQSINLLIFEKNLWKFLTMAVSKLKTSLPPLQIRNDFPKIPGIKIRGLPSHKVSTYFHEKKGLCTKKPPINEWLSYLLLNHVLFLNNSDNRVIFYQPISFCQVMFVFYIDFGNNFWQKTNFGLLQNWRGLSEKGTRNCAKILRKPKHFKVIFSILPYLKSNWNSRQPMQNIFTNYYKNERKISYLFSKWKKVHLDPSRAFTRQTRKKRILCYECSTALWFIVIAGSLFETFSYLVSFAIKFKRMGYYASFVLFFDEGNRN